MPGPEPQIAGRGGEGDRGQGQGRGMEEEYEITHFIVRDGKALLIQRACNSTPPLTSTLESSQPRAIDAPFGFPEGGADEWMEIEYRSAQFIVRDVEALLIQRTCN